jgi:hypothetical protein
VSERRIKYVEGLLSGAGWPKLGHSEFLGGDERGLSCGFCVSERALVEAPGCSSIRTHGAVPTAAGWVTFYAQTAGTGCRHKYPPYTKLSIILGGRELTRKLDRYCTPRYVVTIARRWAKELAP